MNFVGQVVFLNLEHRTDRRQHAETLWHQKLQLPRAQVTLLKAIPAQPGFRGCTQSHLAAVQMAQAHQWPYVLVAEDDYDLEVTPTEWHQIVSEAWHTLHGDFDVLMLGMTPVKLIDTPMPRLKRVHTALALPALIIHQRYYATMQEILETSLAQNVPHDLTTQRYQRRDAWYGVFPPIGTQLPGFSDIEQTTVNYHHVEKGGMINMI